MFDVNIVSRIISPTERLMNSNKKEYMLRGRDSTFVWGRGRGINKENATGGLYLRGIQTK